jgi:hypothetical protein
MSQSEYARGWYKRNKEKVNARNDAWRLANKERWNEINRKWRENNPEKSRISSSAWVRNNPHKSRAKDARHRASLKNAIPAWANNFFVEEIYDLAKRRTLATGIKWQVDHIVPLQSKFVCGLHWEKNLRVITAAENGRKKNIFWPDMPSLQRKGNQNVADAR